MLRTGCPGRDRPSCYGKWHPIYLRFKRGGEKGLWWRVLMKRQQGKNVTMNIALADSTTMKIHRHGGGAKGGLGPAGVNRAGVTTTLHRAITAEDHVIEGFLTGSNVSDITKADELTAKVFGCYIGQDMGYDSEAHRRELEANNNIPVIPGRTNRKTPVVYDKAIYKLRRKIEMFFGKIKKNRRVTIRYEKTERGVPTLLSRSPLSSRTFDNSA